MADLEFTTAPIVTAVDAIEDLFGGQFTGTDDDFNRTNVRDMILGAGYKRKTLAYYGTTDLAAVIDAIGSEPTQLIVGSPTTLAATKAAPSTLGFVWENTGKVTVATGATLTIGYQPVDPGDRQIIELADANAHVRYARGAARKLNVAWIADDEDLTQALDEHLASCTANGGGLVWVPTGEWTTDGDHQQDAKTRIVGEGIEFTTITQTTNDRPMFKQTTPLTFYPMIQDIKIVGICGKLAEVTKTFTDTDVNTSTNQIAIASHGMTTGMEASISQTTVVAAPLSSRLRYYAISTGADTFKLATTKANALATTAIDLTTAGTVGSKAIRGTGRDGGSTAVHLFADTDINTTTNVITITAHGYATGDEVVVGHITTLPAPIKPPEARERYYVIRVNANTIKLAYTEAAALAGTAIDITTAGTKGVNTITAIQWTSSVGLLLEGSGLNGPGGFVNIYRCVIQGFHTGIKVNSTDNGWQLAHLGIDKGSSLLGNDYNIFGNTPNTNIHHHGYRQVNWIPTDGGLTGYGQWDGLFTNHGPMEFTGELAGSFPDSSYYGVAQVEQQIVNPADAITVGGTVYLKVTAQDLRHPVYGTDAYTAAIPVTLTTAHDTGAKIAAAYRRALANDPSVHQLFHVVYDAFNTNGWDLCDANLIFLDPVAYADRDLTANFEIDASGVTGTSSSATSTRFDPAEQRLPNGHEFTGSGNPVAYRGAQDEGIGTTLMVSADWLENSFTFEKWGIQGRVRLNKQCVLKTRDCNIYPKSIRDGGRIDSTVYGAPRYESDDTVQTFPWMNIDGAVSVRSEIPRTHNFANIAADASTPYTGINAFTISHEQGIISSNYSALFFKAGTADTVIPGIADLPALAAMTTDAAESSTQRAAFLGNCNALAVPTYGWYGRRLQAGYFEWAGNQPGYTGWHLNGQMWAQAFIPDQVTVALGGTDVTDFVPGFPFDKGTWRVTLTANSTLRSMSAPTVGVGTLSLDGFEGTWINPTAFSLTITNQDGAGTAGFRFLTPGAVDFVVPAQGSFHFLYDRTSNRWRVS